MTTVVDSSLVVAALVDSGAVGEWAESVIVSDALLAPHLMPVEVTSVLRRSVLADQISADVGSLAHHDLASVTVELFPYAPFAQRGWELRTTVTAYDAWYVAIAESSVPRSPRWTAV